MVAGDTAVWMMCGGGEEYIVLESEVALGDDEPRRGTLGALWWGFHRRQAQSVFISHAFSFRYNE